MHGTSLFPGSRRLALERTLCALVCAGLLLPLAWMAGGWDRLVETGGVEREERPPAWSGADWFSGDYAACADRWFAGHIGLRPFLVRFASQLQYSLFGKIRGDAEGQTLLAGREWHLFRQDYIDVLQPGGLATDPPRWAALLAEGDGLFRKDGIPFLAILAPNKAYVCRERLPPGTRLPSSRPDWTAAAERADVPLLDVNELFERQKERRAFLFPPGGIHWSYRGAWLAWEAAATVLSRRPGLDFPPQPVLSFRWEPPRGLDADMRELLNLWRFEPGGPEWLPYPVVAPPPPGVRRYAALVVGDSFAFGLIDAMARSGRFHRIDLVYYGTSRYFYEAASFSPGETPILIGGRAPGPEANRWRRWRYRMGLPTRRRDFDCGNPEHWRGAQEGVDLAVLVVAETNMDKPWLERMLRRKPL